MTLWINGDWVTGQGALRVKRNPVSGEVLWQGNDADAAQVGQACRAARAAFPRWARLSFGDRDAPRDKCTLSCAINGIHAAFHYLKKNYISGCVMTVPTG